MGDPSGAVGAVGGEPLYARTTSIRVALPPLRIAGSRFRVEATMAPTSPIDRHCADELIARHEGGSRVRRRATAVRLEDEEPQREAQREGLGSSPSHTPPPTKTTEAVPGLLPLPHPLCQHPPPRRLRTTDCYADKQAQTAAPRGGKMRLVPMRLVRFQSIFLISVYVSISVFERVLINY